LPALQLNIDAPDGKPTLFADIALPIPIPKLFTYRVSNEMSATIVVGTRVIVQFGRKKVVTGIVEKLHNSPPEVYVAKPILELLDSEPVVTTIQLSVMKWIASYYMCTLGEVINAALPSGLKISSESRIQLHPENKWQESDYPFDDKELVLLNALAGNDSLTYKDAADLIELKSAYKYMKSLIQKGVILIYEELREKYQPKKVKKIRLKPLYLEEEKAVEALFEKLNKKPKQTDILLKYLQQIPIYQNKALNENGLPKSGFSKAGYSTSSLQTLIKNEVFEEFEEIISRFGEFEEDSDKEIILTEHQLEATEEILSNFEQKDTCLLHGITGSGKTEVYINLIKDILDQGRQVLYLLPEIALTAQIVNRLKRVFGSRMGVYHSKFSNNERVEVWQGLLDGRFDFIVGVRSAVLLPFENLGLIVVDEEHETSYKQYDPAPRYHARDVALYLAKAHQAKTILGSATPSLESYYNASNGKYGLVTLNKRYAGAQLPSMEIANTRTERKRKTIKGNFTSVLVDAIQTTLEKKEQIIIFQNRRGYSNYLSCDDCGFIPECHRCSVSLTYHQYKNQLNCHYCGHKEAVPVTCPACGSSNIRTIGYGTEKIEEDLKFLFPEARIQRMDLETTRSKYAYQNIIKAFENVEIDILVGTQMVSKGFDFDKVSLVGVFDTDRMIHFPDFRSIERTFQLVTQVSGRAGRSEFPGKVIIQTEDPEQKIIKQILAQDYLSFYENEIIDRDKYNYPPFARLIKITLRNRDKKLGQEAINYMANILREDLSDFRVLGPQEPVINKIRDKYLMELFIKIEGKYNIQAVKEIIYRAQLELIQEKKFKTIEVIFNVDPY
jgi:primosomal protein N' (replication factor Y) (superfamily II helicase)